MNDLFPIVETLSPRLKWIAKHGVLTHRSDSCPEAPWIALIPFDEDKGETIGECMARNCRLYEEGGYLGYGMTEDDAIVDMCRNTGLKTWQEEEA